MLQCKCASPEGCPKLVWFAHAPLCSFLPLHLTSASKDASAQHAPCTLAARALAGCRFYICAASRTCCPTVCLEHCPETEHWLGYLPIHHDILEGNWWRRRYNDLGLAACWGAVKGRALTGASTTDHGGRVGGQCINPITTSPCHRHLFPCI